MFKNLIVGIDGLDGGADAYALARLLASDDAEFRLVHAYPIEHTASRASGPDYEAVVRGDAEKLLNDVGPGAPATTRSAVADLSPARALHHVAEEHGADLIVVGACRRGPVGRILLGDVSRTTLHGAPCAVAVAPRDYRANVHRLDSIGVGFNATDESFAALDLAADLARDSGAELRVLTAAPTTAPFVPGYAYSYDLPDIHEQGRIAAQQALEHAVAQLDVPAVPEMIDSRAGVALEELSQHVSLIVAGSRGWGAARRVMLGSTTDHLAHHSSCPVLITPGPAGQGSEHRGTNPETARA